MNRSFYFIMSLWVMLIFGIFLSCDDEMKYSKNPTHVLHFSHDTIHFDTVFTTIGTATYTLKVYNDNKEALNITTVELGRQEKSPFRVNVDGHSGTRFSDLDLRKKDSMHIFVEVTVDPTNENNPILEKDSLIFYMSNGIRQDIKLIAYGQDIFILKGKVIDRDTTFTSLKPIIIYDSLRVNEETTLTLEEGTRLYFHDKTNCHIYGTLKAKGTLQRPVIFRGDRLDIMQSGINIPYDFLAGQWGGVRFYESSYENELNYVDIHGGEYGIRCDSSDISRTKLVLENSSLYNFTKEALILDYSNVFVGNSEIANGNTHCVSLIGGEANFVHCTIAGFHIWQGGEGVKGRKGVALSVLNATNKPLIAANFVNCIVTGTGNVPGSSKNDEITGGDQTEGEQAFNYNFFNCLLLTSLDEDDDEKYEEQISHYHEVVWDGDEENEVMKDKNFLYVENNEYVFDFRLDSLSSAVGIADSRYSIMFGYAYDRYGRSRLADGEPDAGCYEWLTEDQPDDVEND